jgi:hypothetical protein
MGRHEHGQILGRGRARRDGGGNAPSVRKEKLTVVDRCDRCGARAYIRVLLPSRRDLLFCVHHHREHAGALAEIAVEIQDETRRLARAAA